MTNSAAQQAFDNLIFAFDEDITVDTATALAKELGVTFDPEDYCLG